MAPIQRTHTSDAGLAVAGGLINLQGLNFDGTRATDARLAHVARTTNLRGFELTKLETIVYAGRMTDEGLRHLENEKVWDDYHVRGIPDYAVIGPDGKIVADGESTGRDIDKIKIAILKAIGP